MRGEDQPAVLGVEEAESQVLELAGVDLELEVEVARRNGEEVSAEIGADLLKLQTQAPSLAGPSSSSSGARGHFEVIVVEL